MVQLDLKKHTTRKKQYTYRMVIMLCQWEIIRQIETLVRLFLCTSEKYLRKFEA
jgi:hypothetical protein